MNETVVPQYSTAHNLRELHRFAFEEGRREIIVSKNIKKLPPRFLYGCKTLRRVIFEKGSPIAELPNGLFCGCSSLVYAELPERLLEIGTDCFADTALESISFPSTLTRIGEHAFAGCKKLIRAVFADDSMLEIVEKGAFGWSGLYEISLPEGLVELSDSVFASCERLRKVGLPRTLRRLGDLVFSRCALSSIDLPSGLQKIGAYCFAHCDKLLQMVIPESVTQLGEYLLSGCSALEKLSLTLAELSSAVQTFDISSLFLLHKLPRSLKYVRINVKDCSPSITGFQDSEKLVEVWLGDGITSLGDGCFQNCRNLGVVRLPTTLTEIRAYAFWNCVGLKKLDISASLEYLGDYALPTQLLSADNDVLRLVEKNGLLYLNRIALKRVKSDKVLRAVRLAENTVGLYSELFSGCDELTQVDGLSEVAFVGSACFKNCKVLERAEFSDNLKRMGDEAFENCIKLRTIKLGRSLDAIRDGTFRGCALLTSPVLPENLRLIGKSAFEGCASIETATISTRVRKLCDRAYAACTLLRNAWLPTSVDLGIDVFDGCKALRFVRLGSGAVTARFAAALPAELLKRNKAQLSADEKQMTALIEYAPALTKIITLFTGFDPIIGNVYDTQNLPYIDDGDIE